LELSWPDGIQLLDLLQTRQLSPLYEAMATRSQKAAQANALREISALTSVTPQAGFPIAGRQPARI
jgi:hypothetical protein